MSTYRCHKKYPPDLNVHVPQNSNSINEQNLDWVNYTRNLGSLLPFSGLQYWEKNWLKDFLQILLLALSKFERINYFQIQIKVKVSLVREETSEKENFLDATQLD